MNNVADYLKIIVVSFIGIFAINKILEKTGLGAYKA